MYFDGATTTLLRFDEQARTWREEVDAVGDSIL